MNILILDLETTVQWVETIDEETGKTTEVTDNSPFNPDNKIVSAHWRKLEIDDALFKSNGVLKRELTDDDYRLSDAWHSIFYHNDVDNAEIINPATNTPYTIDNRQDLQDALDWADIVVAHNAKYDLMYLLEAGFSVPDTVRCTMIDEYILARGVKRSLSLDSIAKYRDVEQKKLDITKEYFKNKIGFEAMPLPIVLEYADADVLSTAQIFIQQLTDYAKPENATLNNIVILMNEMLWFILEIERNGIKIDLARLKEIEADYIKEREQLEHDLTEIAKSVVGDEPFNLASGPDLSRIVYSREVVDRERHKSIFNIGTDIYGKKKYPPYMTDAQFKAAVRLTTKVAKKKEARHCTVCHGKGRVQKYKVNGDPHKKENKCKVCNGLGYTLTETDAIAGLKLLPERSGDASVHGFGVSKVEIPRLIAQAQQAGKDNAVEFLTKKKRLNAVNTYLNSFVEGIKRWTRIDGRLHANFNQAITATGRLSSSYPNFQNQPKDKKFPIRSCVISRFEGGVITETDFSGLEFSVAGELSRDPQIIDDIRNNKDVHSQTARIVHQISEDDTSYEFKGKDKHLRDSVKPYTFAPLYGGQGANEPSHIRQYFKEFFNIYKRHGEWQVEQMEAVIKTGVVRTPSGREYAFPGTRRLRGGRTTNSTQIVNYPVQGFATGDIVPLACIRAYREFQARNLRSVLILTVHDSIVVDTHPDEKKEVADILKWATEGVVDEIEERWGYEMVLPMRSETSQGPNWMTMEGYHYG